MVSSTLLEAVTTRSHRAPDRLPPRRRGSHGSARRLGYPHMAGDRAALLGEAGHIDGAEALAFQMRGLTEQGRNRHDARAAYAGHQHGVRWSSAGRLGSGRLASRWRRPCRRHAFWPTHLGAVHCHEARAEAVEAGEILVARRLVDGALGAELGLQRRDRNAVRFHAAVAAALAHGRINETRLSGSGKVPRLRRRRFSAAQVWS